MKSKILVLMLLVIAQVSYGQMFKPLQKPVKKYSLNISDSLPSGAQNFQGFRFTGVTALYAFPNSTVFTGTGIDYEHDTYNVTTQRFYTDWAIAGQVFAGGQFAPNNVSGVTAVGLTVFLFNKIVSIGVLYNLTNKKFMGAFGPNANLVPTN